MKFLEKLKYFFDSNKKEELQKIINNLPQNEIICKEILEEKGNNHTNIKLDNDIKNSYYFYLNDTIYLANDKKSREIYARILLIAHECRHTLQSKHLQKLNFILSNIELVLFIMILILKFINLFNIIILVIYSVFVVLSIIIRFILEYDAVKNSVKISKEYMENRLEKKESDFISDIFSFQINLLFPISIVSLFLGKLIRIILVLLLYLVLK